MREREAELSVKLIPSRRRIAPVFTLDSTGSRTGRQALIHGFGNPAFPLTPPRSRGSAGLSCCALRCAGTVQRPSDEKDTELKCYGCEDVADDDRALKGRTWRRLPQSFNSPCGRVLVVEEFGCYAITAANSGGGVMQCGKRVPG